MVCVEFDSQSEFSSVILEASFGGWRMEAQRRELTPFTLSAVCTAASRNSHKISLVLPSNEPWSLIARVAVVGGRILFGSIDRSIDRSPAGSDLG